jgi:hypothetical protein
MLRKWTFLTLIVSLGSSGTLQANPLDSPGIVYIDGLPCNSACQSYMAWSAQTLAARNRHERETNVVAPAQPAIERAEPVVRPRVARQHAPVSRSAPRAATASNSKAPTTKKTAAADPTRQTGKKEIPAAAAALTREKAVAASQQPERKLENAGRPEPRQEAPVALQPAGAPKDSSKESPKSEVVMPPAATLEITPPSATVSLPAASGAAPASARTIQQQLVEATGMADFVTAIGPGRSSAEKSDNPGAESDKGDTDKTASISSDSTDNLVALVLARPEIESLSDLNNRNIAIEEKQAASSGRVSAAFMAAGAAEVQFSEGQRGAIDRLVSGEVPAAVLTLASPEAAEGFPDIAGFRTFRVPLKARH